MLVDRTRQLLPRVGAALPPDPIRPEILLAGVDARDARRCLRPQRRGRLPGLGQAAGLQRLLVETDGFRPQAGAVIRRDLPQRVVGAGHLEVQAAQAGLGTDEHRQGRVGLVALERGPDVPHRPDPLGSVLGLGLLRKRGSLRAQGGEAGDEGIGKAVPAARLGLGPQRPQALERGEAGRLPLGQGRQIRGAALQRVGRLRARLEPPRELLVDLGAELGGFRADGRGGVALIFVDRGPDCAQALDPDPPLAGLQPVLSGLRRLRLRREDLRPGQAQARGLGRLDVQGPAVRIAIREGLIAPGRDRPSVLARHDTGEIAPQHRRREPAALCGERTQARILGTDTVLDQGRDGDVLLGQHPLQAAALGLGQPGPGLAGRLRLCRPDQAAEQIERIDLGAGRVAEQEANEHGDRGHESTVHHRGTVSLGGGANYCDLLDT